MKKMRLFQEITPNLNFVLTYFLFVILVLGLVIYLVRVNSSKKFVRPFNFLNEIPEEIKNETKNHGINIDGEIINFDELQNLHISDTKRILIILSSFFLSLLVTYFSPYLWVLTIILAIFLLITTIQVSKRNLGIGNVEMYRKGSEVVETIAHNFQIAHMETGCINLLKTKDSFLDYLGAQAYLELEDIKNSSWILNVKIWCVSKNQDTRPKKYFFHVNNEKNPNKIRTNLLDDNFFNPKELEIISTQVGKFGTKITIEFKNQIMKSSLDFKIEEPHRVTEEKNKIILEAFQFLHHITTKCLNRDI